MSTLKAYLAMIERAGDPNVIVAMRGFVGGMKTVTPTLEFLQELLKKDPGCDPARTECEAYRANIQIDPLLFRRYGVDKAPTLVYASQVPMVETDGPEPGGPAFIIKGDAGLDYLLERVNREAKSKTLAGLIMAMRTSAEPPDTRK